MTMVGTEWGRRTSVVSWGFVVLIVVLGIRSAVDGAPYALVGVPVGLVVGSLAMGQYSVLIGRLAVRSLLFGFPIVRAESPIETKVTTRGTVLTTRGRTLLLIAPPGHPDAATLAEQVLAQVLRVHGGEA